MFWILLCFEYYCVLCELFSYFWYDFWSLSYDCKIHKETVSAALSNINHTHFQHKTSFRYLQIQLLSWFLIHAGRGWWNFQYNPLPDVLWRSCWGICSSNGAGVVCPSHNPGAFVGLIPSPTKQPMQNKEKCSVRCLKTESSQPFQVAAFQILGQQFMHSWKQSAKI